MKILKSFLPLILLIAFCCKKEHNTVNVPSLTDFPLAAGDTWNYQLYDSINNVTENATFKITGSYALNGPGIYYITQTVVNGVMVDSGQIISRNDSVIYQPNGQGLFSNLTLLFPLSPNKKWHTEYSGDSVFVLASNINYTVLSSTYDSVYNVGRIQSVPDLYIHQNVYIAPHIGIVRQTLDEGTWIPVHKTIKLVSYNLY